MICFYRLFCFFNKKICCKKSVGSFHKGKHVVGNRWQLYKETDHLKEKLPGEQKKNVKLIPNTYLCSLLLFLVFAAFNEKTRFRTSEFDPGGDFGVQNPNFWSKMTRNDLQRRKIRKLEIKKIMKKYDF